MQIVKEIKRKEKLLQFMYSEIYYAKSKQKDKET